MFHYPGLQAKQNDFMGGQFQEPGLRPNDALRLLPLTPVMHVVAGNYQASMQRPLPSQRQMRGMGVAAQSEIVSGGAIPLVAMQDFNLGAPALQSSLWGLDEYMVI